MSLARMLKNSTLNETGRIFFITTKCEFIKNNIQDNFLDEIPVYVL